MTQFTGAGVDPGTSPTLQVAVETLSAKDYQAIKLVDPTAGSEAPIGVLGNPMKVDDDATQTALGLLATDAHLASVLAALVGTLAVSDSTTHTTLASILTDLGGTLAVSDSSSHTSLATIITALGTLGTHTDAAAILAELVLILAKQPRLGTVGVQAADFISVQGDPSGTPVPVSGTFTTSGTMPVSVATGAEVDGHSANIGALADASSANTLTGLLKAIKAAITGTIAVAQPTATLAAGVQVAVTNAAGDLVAAGTYKSIMLRNLSSSAASVFIGPTGVTATTGMEIKPGEFLSFGPGECPSNLIRAITAASTATVIVQVTT